MATDPENFEGGFKTKSYLNSRYHQSSSRFPEYVSKVAPFNKYFGKYCQSIRRGSVDNGSDVKTALEVGSGPCVIIPLLMHPYASRIVLAEYEETNRDELELWKSDSPQAFDWQPFLRSVFEKHGGLPEGASIDSYISCIVKDVRQRVSSIVSCDLLKDPIFDPAVVPEGGFDLVVINQVLCAAATNLDEFNQMFRRVRSVMKEGGAFVCCLSGRSTWYCMDPQFLEHKLPVLYVTEDDVRRAIQGAQLNLLEMDVQPMASLSCDLKECHYFVCRR